MASAPKVVIVTGASRGIGLAVAQFLLKEKHQVVLAARTDDQLKVLKAQFPEQVEYATGDLTGSKAASTVISLAVQKFGKIDGLVINHGVLTPMTRLADASVEEWKKLYDVNFFSAVALLQAAIPELRKSRGSVVWVSSGAATSAYAGWAAYGSSKAALHNVAEHLAREEPDIASVSVSPGRVDTEMQRVLRDEGGAAMDPADHASFVTHYEKGTLNRPEAPAAVLARLAVDPARSLSGKLLRFDSPELAAYRD